MFTDELQLTARCGWLGSRGTGSDVARLYFKLVRIKSRGKKNPPAQEPVCDRGASMARKAFVSEDSSQLARDERGENYLLTLGVQSKARDDPR